MQLHQLAYWWSCIGKGLRLQPAQQGYFNITGLVLGQLLQYICKAAVMPELVVVKLIFTAAEQVSQCTGPAAHSSPGQTWAPPRPPPLQVVRGGQACRVWVQALTAQAMTPRGTR